MKSQIDLFDTSFILHSDEDNEYIQQLVGYIKAKIDDIREDVEINDALKTAILTLLMITHELQTIKKELNATNHHAMYSVKKIISALDANNTTDLLHNEASESFIDSEIDYNHVDEHSYL